MKPIKLDDRERDLARRAFSYLITQLAPPYPEKSSKLTEMARDWTHDELVNLKQKFES